MRRGSLFWGFILVLIGVLLLLDNLGILPENVNVWGLFWPVLLIGLGVWTLWSVARPRQALVGEAVTIPLEGASRAHLRLSHGAGRLDISAGAGPDEIVSGSFAGGLDYRSRREGDELRVRMRVPSDDPPWMRGHDPRDWDVRLNNSLPLTLELKTGASDAHIDLSNLRVTELRLETGASSTELTLPANAGQTRVNISAGAASLNLRVPEGVAAQIHSRGGLSSTTIDPQRFPRQGDMYQSPDYDTATNRADIRVEMGAGSVDVR